MRIADILHENKFDNLSDEFWYCLALYVLGYLDRPLNMQDSLVKRVIAAFDKEMPTLSRSMKVYRGMSMVDWDSIHSESDFRNSSKITLPGYISTSKSSKAAEIHMAEEWISKNWGEHKAFVLFDIKTKSGTRGIVINSHLKRLKQVINSNDKFYGCEIFTNEQEVLLGKDCQFEVKSTSERENEYGDLYSLVELEQIV